jgi:predicted membrane protein (TIGR00267 family)
LVLRRIIKRLNLTFTLTETTDIARRYFSLQIFDGAMVGIGLVFGFHISGFHGYESLLRAIIPILIGIAISGYTGAFVSERAEQAYRIRRLERATLTEMSGTMLASVGTQATIFVSLVNSLSAVTATALVSTPYILASALKALPEHGLYLSMIICLALLSLSGSVVGKTTGIGVLRTALQMAGAGVVAAALIILVESAL